VAGDGAEHPGDLAEGDPRSGAARHWTERFSSTDCGNRSELLNEHSERAETNGREGASLREAPAKREPDDRARHDQPDR
jgi:hypothetical protein